MKKLIACLVCVALVSGCSAFGGRKQNLTVMTNVKDSQIYVNGKPVGIGMTTLKVPKNKSVQIMAQRDGYETAYQSISTSFSTLGVLDLIGGCIFWLPFLGLLFPGSQELSEPNAVLHLEKVV